MHVLPLPKNFLEPQSMRQSPVPAWIRWIREESEKIVSDLEEEIRRRNNPDDPFDGTASGIFEPLEHDTRTPLIPLPKEKKSTERKQKMEKSRSLPSNNGTPVQNKETIESEQIEQARRQNERSVILVNERVTRQEEEQLIDHPSILQLEPNGMPATNSRKSEKTHSSLDQGTHLQPFQMSTGYPEVHRYTPTYAIGERRRDQSNRRIPYEEPITRDPESTHEVQRKSNYLQQSHLQSLLHASGMPQGQLTSEEFDPCHTVRKLHMRQREFITQPQLPNTSFPVTGQKEGHVENDSALTQETPKPQRERIGRRRTVQTNVRNTLTEPLEEISYMPRDSHSLQGQQFTEGNTNQLDLTSYMQLPSVEQDSKMCGKCGEQGHMKRQCTANVACDFCKTKSHSTLVCRTYANFVKEHPLTSSRKNTPEKFRNKLDVNMEVAKRVEMELRKWQREHEPKGKPPLPQLRKQQMMNSQQHSIQETPYSQDIRVQLGE